MRTSDPSQMLFWLKKPTGWFVCFGTLLLFLASIKAAEETVIAAVSGRVSDDYIRVKLTNGSFQPESYAFGEGGYWSGRFRDSSIERINFKKVAKIISISLDDQKYIAATDAKTTKLLIMVYWGTTSPQPPKESPEFQNAAMANQFLQQAKAGGDPDTIRSAENAYSTSIAALQAQNTISRRLNAQSAGMLGYDSWWDATAHFEGTVFDLRWKDMIEELEEDRYFVVLMAYDFQLLWKEKKHKLLWETRFSISERNHEFDKELAAMALQASRYFGQNSHGLIRKPLHESVTLDELKILGVEEEKK